MNATPPSPVTTVGILRLPLIPALLIAAVLITSSSTIRAATIGVDFAAGSPSHALGAGVSAGVVPQINWNNILTTTATGAILSDNTGTATTAALTFTASAGGSYNPGAVGGDELLNDTWVATFSPTITINVGSIPYASYDLIIYNLPLFSSVDYTYTVGSTSYFGKSPSTSPTSSGYVDNNLVTPYTYTQAVSTSSGSPTIGADYTRFDGLTGGALTFSVTGGNGIAYINGFQIIESVPEPSRAMLLLAGLLTIAGRRTRRSL